MLCSNCGKHEAIFHYKSNVNGELSEKHLCSECATNENAVSVSQDGFIDTMFSDIFSTMLPKQPDRRISRTCPLCGATERDITAVGKVGCANCYDTFSDMLVPYIRRIHGNTQHTGKTPATASKEIRIKRELENLRNEMKGAIERQEFERAAELRDRIKSIEEGGYAG